MLKTMEIITYKTCSFIMKQTFNGYCPNIFFFRNTRKSMKSMLSRLFKYSFGKLFDLNREWKNQSVDIGAWGQGGTVCVPAIELFTSIIPLIWVSADAATLLNSRLLQGFCLTIGFSLLQHRWGNSSFVFHRSVFGSLYNNIARCLALCVTWWFGVRISMQHDRLLFGSLRNNIVRCLALRIT